MALVSYAFRVRRPCGLLLLTGAWLFSESTPFAALNGFFAWRGVLNQYTGALAMGVMSLAIILAVRPRWLEGPLDGLDKLDRKSVV